MKLSEAILLGSTVLSSKPGGQYFRDADAGCALGMAAVATGCSFAPPREAVAVRERRTVGTENVWGSWVLQVAERPCDCWRIRVPREMRIKDIIAHLFDRHVTARRDWTLEHLAQWVASVEPAEHANARAASSDAARTRTSVADVTTPTRSLDQPTEEEMREWQATRGHFQARYNRTHRRNPTGT